jgi:bifunctional non-homologous end joining protein LigD
MKLFKYKAKRNLKSSKEPLPVIKKKKSTSLAFVIQEHHASHLHYDLRLEVGGVLKSWAVPKKLSMDPKIKRLAIMVEDHPYSYKDFEGTIPSGYGAGTVKIWDRGTYSVDELDAKEAEKKIQEGLKKGSFHFSLSGKKLKGIFYLVRLKKTDKDEWLLIKKRDKKMVVKNKKKQTILTNLDKIFWPKEKITKGDLLRYYEKISSCILPHLKDRPISLKRFPNGIEGRSFFQKDLKDSPDWVETITIDHEKKKVHYLLINNEESLLYAANLGSIEIHPFLSRSPKLHFPNFLIFDLDPKEAPFTQVIEVAQTLHKVLEEIEVPSFCKTSGATGLHIAIPLGAKYNFDQSKHFAELIANIVHQRLPKITTLERSLSKRKARIYIDCYQNNYAQTVAAPYSVRARIGAPVSTPLKWSEVKEGLDPKKYTIKTIPARVKKMGDLYFPVLGKGIDLRAALHNITKMKS